MKKMNRREFLTLSGAAVVALSLAGCGGPSAPPAPAAPTQKELDLLKALNLMLEDYWKVGGHPENIRTLSYSQDASDFARHFVSPCVKADQAYELSGPDFKDTFLKMLNKMDTETRDLGIYCPTVAGKDYIVIAPLSDRRLH